MTALTQDQVNFFKENQYLIVDNFFSSDEIKSFNNSTNAVMSNYMVKKLTYTKIVPL